MHLRQAIKLVLMQACRLYAIVIGIPQYPAVLMYHSFDETDWKHGVSASELKKQIEYLLENHTVVPLADIAAWVRGEADLPNNAVAITIDDGYTDTYDVFFPLAQWYQLPFTLFLTTDLKTQSKLGNLRRPTVEQLQEMHRSGLMTVGLHGHTHQNFPEVLETGRETEEIKASEQFIVEVFSSAPTAVAYPAGRVNETVFAYFREAGYSVGCTTRPGFVTQGDDLLRLRRIGVDRTTTMSLFRLRLSSGFPLYLKLVRLFK